LVAVDLQVRRKQEEMVQFLYSVQLHPLVVAVADKVQVQRVVLVAAVDSVHLQVL
jgi:hypothetical protein